MNFNKKRAEQIAEEVSNNDDEKSLIPSFIEVCLFLSEFPSELSWRTSKANPVKPSVDTEDGVRILANRYFDSYRRSDFPVQPSTIPDEMVSVIMENAYGYSKEFPMERRMRDAWGWGIAGGAIDIQKTNIASAMVGRRFNQRA